MIQTISEIYKTSLYRKKIAAIDFGLKRIGLAYCDEFHVTVTPFKTLYFESDTFWNDLLTDIRINNIHAVVIGVPYRLDNKDTDIIVKIKEFIITLHEKLGMEIIEFDESYSTVRSVKTMIDIGKKKKFRAKKEEKDKIAAAIILRDFLEELDG